MIRARFELEFVDDDCKIRDFKFKLGNTTVLFNEGEPLKMQQILPDDSEVSFVLPTTGLDARGNTVTLKTIPTAEVSDSAILTIIQPDPATPDNPASGVLRAVGLVGGAQFVVKDEDESSVPLTIIVDVSVVAGELVSLSGVTFGETRKQSS